MRVVKIKKSLISKFKKDPELLVKEDRPCVLVIKLDYRGTKRDFAIPLRSNIPPATPKDEYFSLPPRSSTKDKHHHGIHYTKMFPVAKEYYERYRTEGDPASTLICAVIDKHEKEIVQACQSYLNKYEANERSLYATDLDLLIGIIDPDSLIEATEKEDQNTISSHEQESSNAGNEQEKVKQ